MRAKYYGTIIQLKLSTALRAFLLAGDCTHEGDDAEWSGADTPLIGH